MPMVPVSDDSFAENLAIHVYDQTARTITGLLTYAITPPYSNSSRF